MNLDGLSLHTYFSFLSVFEKEFTNAGVTLQIDFVSIQHTSPPLYACLLVLPFHNLPNAFPVVWLSKLAATRTPTFSNVSEVRVEIGLINKTRLRLSIADAVELLQVSDGRELVAVVVVGEAAVYVVVVIEYATELLQVPYGRESVAAVVVEEVAMYVVVVIENQQTAAKMTPTFSNVFEVWIEVGLINKASKRSLKVDAAELLQVSDGRELVAAIVVGEAAVVQFKVGW
ncbi:hypothetical protein Godav_025530 [Gossypium davidsonii]|uniref:Uncharacterized protein n=1 Tax=Gossypium davidsonii TaxID=34287 RepID=A0A7J8TA24_GOSDV|nr:hypothetical protein [Gossypium davidsonii]